MKQAHILMLKLVLVVGLLALRGTAVHAVVYSCQYVNNGCPQDNACGSPDGEGYVEPDGCYQDCYSDAGVYQGSADCSKPMLP